MGTLPTARFGRVLTAMITPFDSDGYLDIDGAQTLARWLVDHGSDGLVVNGTTGESPTLSATESIDLFRAVRQAVDQHFRMIAAATELPVIVYDIPVRTGRKVATDTIVRLAHEVPTIVALKDAAGDPAETAVLVEAVPEGFEVYSGDDNLTLPFLSVGARGVVSVTAHWAGPQLQAMFAAFDAGDLAEARRINASLLPSYAFQSTLDAPNPVPTKAMMRTLGLPSGECRPPMGPTPDGLEVQAKEIWDDRYGLSRWHHR